MRNEIVVQKMAGYVRKVLDYCRGYDYATFSADSKLVEACVFNLSQLGELCKVADDSFTAAHPEIPWRAAIQIVFLIVDKGRGIAFPTGL